MNRATILAASAAISLIFLATAQVRAATVPSDVDDLVGARASSGESQLQDRGYHHVKNLKVSSSIIGYWWNSRRQACIAVTTNDGRYKSILSQPEQMCQEDHASYRDNDSHNNDRYRSSTPEVRTVDGGNVAVDLGGCNVLFNNRGSVINQGSSCTNSDVNEARGAYSRHQREQNAYAGDEAPPGGFSTHGSGGGMVTCESVNNGYQYCRTHVGNARVTLTRRLSSSGCREGDSWGYDRDGVWVDKGCRAEFEVR